MLLSGASQARRYPRRSGAGRPARVHPERDRAGEAGDGPKKMLTVRVLLPSFRPGVGVPVARGREKAAVTHEEFLSSDWK